MTRRELERIDIPGEHGARVRTWEVVRAAHAGREAVARRRPPLRPALVLAALLAVVAAAASPPGRAVIDEVREAVGVERAAPALSSLPAEGRLLASSDVGSWIVGADGSKRLLAGIREASWSPFGRFVVGVGADELVALEPDGDVRWTLARPGVRHPAWGGSASDTRIAYLSGRRLAVVAGDGTDDRSLTDDAAPVVPAWRPRSRHVVTYATRTGRVVTLDAEARRVLWRTPPGPPVARLQWSHDGRRLLVLRAGRVDVHTRAGARLTGIRPETGEIAAAAFRPGSHAVAYAVASGGQTRVALVDEPSAVLFTGPGRIDELAWSPNGRWLLLGWPAADQWLFVRPQPRAVRAVSSISEQFRSASFPSLAGWCCASSR